MFRKILSTIVLVLFLMSSLALAADPSQEVNALDKTVAVEKVIYGTEQTGALVDRVKKLETDIYNTDSQDALLTKIDKLYAYVKGGNGTESSLLLRLNAAEWSVAHTVNNGPALQRLDNLEHSIYGASEKGGIDERITKLLSLTYPAGQVNAVHTTVNKDLLIKIQMVSSLDSRSSRVGDEVIFQAAEDVYSGGVLVVAKGAMGSGKVTKVERSRNFGRDAVLEMSFDSIASLDGSPITTYVGDKAKEKTQSLAKAAGATVAGMVVLGPIGVVGGAFVKGKDISVAPGAIMYIQTQADALVEGLSVSN